MPSKKNIEQVKDLTEKLKKANSVVLVDYKGLTHQQLADFRSKLKELGSSLAVTKNTLLKLSLKKSKFAIGEFENLQLSLEGPTATLFISADPLPPLKALNQFLTEFGLPQIKIGILEGEVVDKEKIIKLATLPSKDILMTQVVWGLKVPTQRLSLALACNLRKLNLTLKSALEAKQKQEVRN